MKILAIIFLILLVGAGIIWLLFSQTDLSEKLGITAKQPSAPLTQEDINVDQLTQKTSSSGAPTSEDTLLLQSQQAGQQRGNQQIKGQALESGQSISVSGQQGKASEAQAVIPLSFSEIAIQAPVFTINIQSYQSDFNNLIGNLQNQIQVLSQTSGYSGSSVLQQLGQKIKDGIGELQQFKTIFDMKQFDANAVAAAYDSSQRLQNEIRSLTQEINRTQANIGQVTDYQRLLQNLPQAFQKSSTDKYFDVAKIDSDRYLLNVSCPATAYNCKFRLVTDNQEKNAFIFWSRNGIDSAMVNFEINQRDIDKGLATLIITDKATQNVTEINRHASDIIAESLFITLNLGIDEVSDLVKRLSSKPTF